MQSLERVLEGTAHSDDESGRPESEAVMRNKVVAHMEARLHRAVTAVTSHLEAGMKRYVHESHDAIFARIDDVIAASIAQHCASLCLSQSTMDKPDETTRVGLELSGLQDRVARLEGTAAECGGLQRRQEELETLMMRIAQTTARDAAAGRSKTEAEIRGLGGCVQLKLDGIEARLASVRQELQELAEIKSPPEEVTTVTPYALTTFCTQNLKVELRDEFRRELESRDSALAWLWDLRDFATELKNMQGDLADDKHADVTVAARSETISEAVPAQVGSIQLATLPSCADAGAGSLLTRELKKGSDDLVTQISDTASEWPASRVSAIAHLADLLAAKRDGTNTTAPTAPTNELIQAAARELVSIRLDEKASVDANEEDLHAKIS